MAAHIITPHDKLLDFMRAWTNTQRAEESMEKIRKKLLGGGYRNPSLFEALQMQEAFFFAANNQKTAEARLLKGMGPVPVEDDEELKAMVHLKEGYGYTGGVRVCGKDRQGLANEAIDQGFVVIRLN